MSRCFPFPPPAYANKGPYREALVVSNKPQKEKEGAKTERRKEKRSKLRKEDKHKKTRICVTDVNVKKPEDEKKRFQQGKFSDLNAKYTAKNVDNESEQNSDLTEELEPPTVSSTCYLSDVSQSSNKRKKQESSVTEKPRITFRIKLPLRKHSEPVSLSSEQDENCCSMGPETRAKEGMALGHVPSGAPLCQRNVEKKKELEQAKQKNVEKKELEEANLKACLELPLPTQEAKSGTGERTSSRLDSVEFGYETLIGNWVPEPPMHQLWQDDDGDQDWLFGSRKQQDKQDSKRQKANVEESCLISTTSWPQAQYLPKADIWALPYTVPF